LLPILLISTQDLKSEETGSLLENLQLCLIIYSITSSVLSLAVTFTMLYFGKSSKVEQKCVKNIFMYFAAVLCQCIARLLAFQGVVL
jgi:hypothetical protein